VNDFARHIFASRRSLVGGRSVGRDKKVQEGGCGVVGFAASVPVCGRHIFEPSIQMHNRGNGKGGGVAAACLNAEQLGVDSATLRDDYLLQIALLDGDAERVVEENFITPYLRIDHRVKLAPATDYRELGLDVCPPDVVRYFVRVKPNVLARFAEANNLSEAPARAAEDEFIYQNSFKLNRSLYASLGDKRAFVLSHARNLMLFKIVGYAEQVVQYYGMEELEARVWIAHQRYPTKGRVWHPAGAHPFIGMHEALVHNGDFANYFSISEYLRQHNTVPLFLTDTEVSVLLFDLWSRVYRYRLEYVIEALAPTTELDFDCLPEDKQAAYRAIQALHIHGSPDGPWFFIIARNDTSNDRFQLLGITDTAMLRPQVFALQEGDVTIGLVASEKQAIDATLHSLSEEDRRFRPVADRYWNARGGSHTDGGAFTFTVNQSNGASTVTCTDKFGTIVSAGPGRWTVNGTASKTTGQKLESGREFEEILTPRSYRESFGKICKLVGSWDFEQLKFVTGRIGEISGGGGTNFDWATGLLCLLNDRRYDCGDKKRSVVLQIVREAMNSILDSTPLRNGEETLVICACGFWAEGDDCNARLLERAYQLGWRRFIVYRLKGQRFTGCGLGPRTEDVRIDVFGSSGDYLASGIDGMEIYVHDSVQDQVGQIIKSGKLVIFGDVGQTFMYGAKGGEVYVMGSAAGRPLINAVGRPRVVINGTCLDFLAESFMAGDPHNGGGFVILNGIEFDYSGCIKELPSPYPGSNLFSLASGGAMFVRDPHHKLVAEQLNGGKFEQFTEKDWELIGPYLQSNERYFGISVERDLLRVDGVSRAPGEVYRKVSPVKLSVLAKEGVPE